MASETLMLWLCRDDRSMEPKDMETTHIRNSIARIRRLQWRGEWIPIFLAELERRELKDDPSLNPARLTNRFRNLDFE